MTAAKIWHAVQTSEYDADDYGSYNRSTAYEMAVEEKRENPEMHVQIAPMWDDSGELVDWMEVTEITEEDVIG